MAFLDFLNLGGRVPTLEELGQQQAQQRGYNVGQAPVQLPEFGPPMPGPRQETLEEMGARIAPQYGYGKPPEQAQPPAMPPQMPNVQRPPLMFGAPPPDYFTELQGDPNGTANAGLPPMRPSAMSAPSADKPSPAATPAGPAASPATAAVKPQDEGFFSKLMKGLSNNSDELIYMGAGLASSPRWGEGLIKGMSAANQASAGKTKAALEQLKLARETQGLMGTAQWLVKEHGVPPDQAIALAQNPAGITKLIEAKYGKDGSPKIQQTGTDQFGKPTYSVVQGDNTIRPLKPDEAGASASAAPTGPAPPPGVDPAEWYKKQADAKSKEQEAQLERGRVAMDMAPQLKRAYEAYSKLAQSGTFGTPIGPVSASGINRTIGGMVGTDSEKLRQEYEAASKNLELTQAQLKMKGQGAITENERKILALTLPRLDAADPSTGIKTLEEMHKLAQQEYEAAKAGKTRMQSGEQFPSLNGGARLPNGVTIRRVN